MAKINRKAIAESESVKRGLVEATKSHNAVAACDPNDISQHMVLQRKHEAALMALGTVVLVAAHEPHDDE